MSGDVSRPAVPALTVLDGYNDARAVVKLFQCSHCSYPLKDPLTLPCGNSLCRTCLPPTHKRENITYPLVEGRAEGFLCPFEDCGLEHSLGDTGADVTLNKMVHIVQGYVTKYKTEAPDVPEIPILLEEILHGPSVLDSSIDIMPRSRVLHGGRLIATYIFADMGELNYLSDVVYTPQDKGTAGAIRALDVAVLENLKEVIRAEVECEVCCQILLDPLTTPCGHTLCRKCVARSMDHSNRCPMCRRRLTMLPGAQTEPTNKNIQRLLEGFWSDLLAARVAVAQQDEANHVQGRLPLFPCTLAYPQMPTFLHIFEPRYRLMVRRVMENGTRRFGMLMHRPGGVAQGQPHYMPYGTVLYIDRLEMLPDGRSLMETRGLHRFRVLETSVLDGYLIGHVERVDDVAVSEEEAAEARETSTTPPAHHAAEAEIQSMSTQRLLEYCLQFVEQARSRSARWLHQRVLAAYGQPPTDPAIFPYWFASVLPISETEKYLLLPATSVRERLKITARWIQRLEAARCEFEAEQRALAAQTAQQRETEHMAQARETTSTAENTRETPSEPATDDPEQPDHQPQ